MTNPIVELFNQTDKKYQLVYLEGYSNDLWITSKFENTATPELDLGEYGAYADKVFQFLKDLFTTYFGKGECLSFSTWNDSDSHKTTWYYNGFFLELVFKPGHPKTSDYRLYIKTGPA